MIRDWKNEFENRVRFIKDTVAQAHCDGIVFGNSGGKDSALVGILCKAACGNTQGVIMPCQSARNFESDLEDACKISEQFGIETMTVDLSGVKLALTSAIGEKLNITAPASSNIAPRLRMTTLYAIAQSRNSLVAGTGNKSEAYMGYFTKWGDGAHDFNPIRDLTVTEVLDFLKYLGAPMAIIEKAPSAGLYDGQTDERDMGVTYSAIDKYLSTGIADEKDLAVIERYHRVSEHKRRPIKVFLPD